MKRRSSMRVKSIRQSSGRDFVPRPDNDWRQKYLIFIDQPGPDCVGGEIGPAHRQIMIARCFEAAQMIRIESAFQRGLRCGN